MLTVKNLNKSYKSNNKNYEVLKNISLNINKGEFVSLMGPSGSGKTTLLNCISGFLEVDSGSVILDKSSILSSNEEEISKIRQNKLGFIFQDFMLISGLTTEENIYLPQIISNKNIQDVERETDLLMRSFGIENIKGKYPTEISGGQKQRVAIARALSNKPLILLADEPTGNLDSKSSLSVIESFVHAKKSLGATIFMVTHDAFTASYSDRVIALKDGEIVKELVRKESPKVFLNEILTFMNSINGDNYEY
ncbi:ABC transporter ATP-binding protein [Paraclostridium sordellii]|uniref:ABC transporter ATP-binding protein n=1 Tax=Paraclostridium sordellii TaxID=1505 RepID=UPI0005E4B4AD|nr:ABC transporter ATP-binding protein [Paeniclostridium sordellii]CEN26391.1 ABC transporter ATP-binding protein [[Clostridium] sordellii] [Paeniclostridium sordellii]